jgi:hypothetical protein
MLKKRVRHGQKPILKESAQNRDASMHRLIWSAVRNWVPAPESTRVPSQRVSVAQVKATLSPRRLITTRAVLSANTLAPVPGSDAHTAAIAILRSGIKARADMDVLQDRTASATSDHAKTFLLRDPDQVLDKGQAGTTLH